ncbi:hypothetical protein KV205_28475 [Streptomyces sp. SKN60]|uniref:hypothetical protein n=1 Tax=Streptomyces sp. SKN60 TaxID=2855506 RepID=UPI002246E810|nr:hypothetical protein [Streptomyces sp. SKN60]MCX2184438.1 hypothetical protein [Streptomyces sp. SKN60]
MTTTATRYDRRMYAVMNNREAAALFATAGRRKALVGVHIALTAGVLGAFFGWGGVPGAITMVALLLPWVVATGAINGATRGLLELRARMLDERQLVERDRVRSLAHQLTGRLLLAGTAAVVAAELYTDVDLSRLTVPLMVAALVLHLLSPLWVAGLRVQDEPSDDES